MLCKNLFITNSDLPELWILHFVLHVNIRLPNNVCAEHEGSKSTPRQDAAQQEADDNKMDNADGRSEQRHVIKAESGPEVHVDKAAGTVSITGLPLGCRYITRGPSRAQHQVC